MVRPKFWGDFRKFSKLRKSYGLKLRTDPEFDSLVDGLEFRQLPEFYRSFGLSPYRTTRIGRSILVMIW